MKPQLKRTHNNPQKSIERHSYMALNAKARQLHSVRQREGKKAAAGTADRDSWDARTTDTIANSSNTNNTRGNMKPHLLLGTWAISHLLLAAAAMCDPEVGIRVFSVLHNNRIIKRDNSHEKYEGTLGLQLTDLDVNLLLASFLRYDVKQHLSIGSTADTVNTENTSNIDIIRSFVVRAVLQKTVKTQLHSYVRDLIESAAIQQVRITVRIRISDF